MPVHVAAGRQKGKVLISVLMRDRNLELFNSLIDFLDNVKFGRLVKVLARDRQYVKERYVCVCVCESLYQYMHIYSIYMIICK